MARRRSTQYPLFLCLFFFNDTATTEIYTLSLHDALPICTNAKPASGVGRYLRDAHVVCGLESRTDFPMGLDRKSTRLNSSHTVISYAVFCLKKKKLPNEGALLRLFISESCRHGGRPLCSW